MLSVARYHFRKPIRDGCRMLRFVIQMSSLVAMQDTKSFLSDCCNEIPRRLEGTAVSLPGFGTGTRIDLFHVVGIERS
jgi:hypothetical protein